MKKEISVLISPKMGKKLTQTQDGKWAVKVVNLQKLEFGLKNGNSITFDELVNRGVFESIDTMKESVNQIALQYQSEGKKFDMNYALNNMTFGFVEMIGEICEKMMSDVMLVRLKGENKMKIKKMTSFDMWWDYQS